MRGSIRSPWIGVAQQATQDVFAETGKEQRPHVLHLHDLAGHQQDTPQGAYLSTQRHCHL